MTESRDADFAEDQGPDAPVPDGPALAGALIVDVDGYEGPLDVLLVLAKTQKVDLKKISILALVDQYMSFIAAARRLQLELAADYLVMAAWLAYLKSRLLLPPPEEETSEPTGAELAARLAYRLQRLQAMRDAAARLMARDRLGRDVFARGMPDGIRVIRTPNYKSTIYDLLKAYSDQRIRSISHDDLQIKKVPIFAVEEARKRIERLFGRIKDWSTIDSLLPEGWLRRKSEAADKTAKWRSAKASTLAASLELVKDGHMEIKQLVHFGPIYVRRREVQ
jgi:segregation and condensation protein A